MQVPVILLTVDAELKSGHMELKAHLRLKAGVPGSREPHSAIFLPLKVELAMFEPEETCLDLISSGLYNQTRQVPHLTLGREGMKKEGELKVTLPSGLGQLHESLDKMLGWLEEMRAYVGEVLAGKRAGDPVMGRKLINLVSSVAKVQPAKFEDMVNGSVKVCPPFVPPDCLGC